MGKREGYRGQIEKEVEKDFIKGFLDATRLRLRVW